MPGFNFEGNSPNFTIASGDKIENACVVSITARVMYNFVQYCEVRKPNNNTVPALTAYELWKTTGFPVLINNPGPFYDPGTDTDGDGQHLQYIGTNSFDIKTRCIPIGSAPVTVFQPGSMGGIVIQQPLPFTVKTKPINNYPSKYKGPGSAWDDEKKKRLGILPKWCKDEDDQRVVQIPVEKTLEFWWPGCEGCSPKEFEDLLKADPLIGGGIDGFLHSLLFREMGLDYRGFQDLGFNYNNWQLPRIWAQKGHLFPGYDPNNPPIG